jgi:hypothetical protein
MYLTVAEAAGALAIVAGLAGVLLGLTLWMINSNSNKEVKEVNKDTKEDENKYPRMVFLGYDRKSLFYLKERRWLTNVQMHRKVYEIFKSKGFSIEEWENKNVHCRVIVIEDDDDVFGYHKPPNKQ